MRINEFNNLTFGKKYNLIPSDELTKRLRQNMTYPQIAKEFNVTESVVARSVEHWLLALSDDKYKIRIYKLYLNKFTVEEIKNLFGYPIKYIKSVIKQYEAESESNSKKTIRSIIDKFELDHDVLKNLK